MTYLRYFFFLVISFLVFCIPISNRPLFNHLYDAISPTTKKLITYIKNEGQEKLNQGKKAGVKYILNSVPEEVKKLEIPKSEDPLSIEEKNLLEQIL